MNIWCLIIFHSLFFTHSSRLTVIHHLFFSVNPFFITIWFEPKVPDKRSRFKITLHINIHYSHTPVLWRKKKNLNRRYILRKLPFHSGPKYTEDPVQYDSTNEYRTRAKRPTSRKWIIVIDPSVVQLILLFYFWIH